MPISSSALPQLPGQYVSVVSDFTPATVDADFAVTRGVFCATAGNLHLIMADGTTATLNNVPAGKQFDGLRIIGTRAAGTTITSLMRLY